MLRYHLKKVRYPRLVFLVAVVGSFIWLGFRPGGTEVGDNFGSYGLARFWALVTPMVLLIATPMIAGLWNGERLERNWRLAQTESGRARRDRMLNFVVGFLTCAAILVLLGSFAFARLPADFASYASFFTVLLIGPLAGAYATLALGYIIGLKTRSPAIRMAVISAIALIDVVNLIPTPILSLSGTTRVAEHTGAWSPELGDAAFSGVALPSTWFWVSRLVLCVGVTAWLLASKVRYRLEPVTV